MRRRNTTMSYEGPDPSCTMSGLTGTQIVDAKAEGEAVSNCISVLSRISPDGRERVINAVRGYFSPFLYGEPYYERNSDA